MVAGIVIGGFLGTMVPSVMTALGFIGDTFLGGLTILSFVVVAATLVTAVSGLGDINKFRYAFFKNLGFWGVTLLLAIGIALGLGQFVLTEPSGAAISGARNLPGSNSGSAVIWLGSILAAIGMGLAAIRLKIRARSLTTWFKNLAEGVESLTGLLSYILPVGLMFAVANYVARDGYKINDMTWLAGNYVLTVIIGLALLGLIIMPLILGLISGVNPFSLLGRLLPAILTAFGTMSSRLALPFVISALESDKQCDKRATGLAVSLGTVFNVAPTVLVVMVATMFMANVTGTTISVYQILLIGLTSAALSIGIGSGTGMIVPIMVGALSLTGDIAALSPALTLVIGVTWLLEPVKAAFTTQGDAVSAAVLSQSFEFKTALRSPARTAPRKFGFDRAGRTDARGRRSERPSGRGRPAKSDSGTEKSPRGRRPSSKETDRTQSTDKSRGRGRDRKDSRVSRGSQSRSTFKGDTVVKDDKDLTGSKAEAKGSPFSLNSGGDPALEMAGSTPVKISSEETGSGRPRSRSRSGDSRRTDRKSGSTDSSRRRSSSRPSRDSESSEPRSEKRLDKVPRPEETGRQSGSSNKELSSDSQTDTIRDEKSSLTTSKIKDELARVSEQLRGMDDRIKPIDIPAESKEVSAPAPPPDMFDTKEPAVDSKSIDSKPVVEKSAGISDEEKSLAASFGRSKERPKSPSPESSGSESEADDSSPDQASEPVTVRPNSGPDDPDKPIEFGRSKRKKRMR